MTPRLNHRKSRNGCKTCKRRRVKCDEVHPICSSCKRHGVLCEYPIGRRGGSRMPSETSASTSVHTPPSRPDLHSPPASSASSSCVNSTAQLDVDDDILPAPDERRRLELFLLHQFCSATVPSFPRGEDGEPTGDLWSAHVVGLGLAHQFLLDSIFSLAALHLDHSLRLGLATTADENPTHSSDSARMATTEPLSCPINPSRAHRVYFDLALKQQREALTSINRQNANALLMTTVLLSIQVLAPSRDERHVDGHTPPIRWLHLTRGIADLTTVLRRFPRLGTLLETMSLKYKSPDFHNLEMFFSPENRKPFERLLDWEANPEPDFSPEKQKAYEDALSCVGAVYMSIQRRDHYASIFRQLMCLGLMTPSLFLVCIE
jgi:hypothetical protein